MSNRRSEKDSKQGWIPFVVILVVFFIALAWGISIAAKM
jgi:hypothetical protein